MPKTKPKIGILTGGGDCPGLNNAIKKVVLGANDRYNIDGLVLGWEGPIRIATSSPQDRRRVTEAYTYPLGAEEVRRIDREGGTILMASRENPFKCEGRDVSDEVVNDLNSRYYAVIAIGGEDTLGAAGKMAQKGLRVIGIPKTIDKDLCGTEYTLGFDSAVNRVQDLVTSLKYTAGSHGMLFFVETMGRHAGHLTYWGGRSADVHFMTIPEVEVDPNLLFELIQTRKKSMKIKRGFNRDGLRYAIVLIAEGTRLTGVGEVKKGKIDSHGNVHLGGVANYLFQKYVDVTGDENARPLVLGHLQRGGVPSHKDRYMGEALAQRSLQLLNSGLFGRMATIQGNDIDDVSLDVVVGRIRILDAQKCYDRMTLQAIISPENTYNEMEIPKGK